MKKIVSPQNQSLTNFTGMDAKIANRRHHALSSPTRNPSSSLADTRLDRFSQFSLALILLIVFSFIMSQRFFSWEENTLQTKFENLRSGKKLFGGVNFTQSLDFSSSVEVLEMDDIAKESNLVHIIESMLTTGEEESETSASELTLAPVNEWTSLPLTSTVNLTISTGLNNSITSITNTSIHSSSILDCFNQPECISPEYQLAVDLNIYLCNHSPAVGGIRDHARLWNWQLCMAAEDLRVDA